MNIRLSFKTPDVLDEVPDFIRDALRKWIKWSEYITVEYDSDTDTIRVVPVGE